MFLEKIKINTEEGNIRQIRFFNYPFLEYFKNEKEQKKYFKVLPNMYKSFKNNNKKVFYLKINRNENYSFLCLQQWIDVVNFMGADFYIVCDSNDIEKEIYKKIKFKNANIKIIKSHKNLKNNAEKLFHKKWVNAGIAHMTPFYHSKRIAISAFWNIDADDTMLCFSIEKIASLLNQAESYSNLNNISCFSLDMWRSRSNNVHWSFGITYIQNNVDYISYFNEFLDINWQKDYAFYNTAMNIDWFFNYLSQYRKLTIYSFYPENGYFIHWGDFLVNVFGSSICYWQDNNVYYPILIDIAKNKNAGLIPVAKDCYQINLNLKLEDSINYLNTTLFNFDTNIKK